MTHKKIILKVYLKRYFKGPYKIKVYLKKFINGLFKVAHGALYILLTFLTFYYNIFLLSSK